jgi:hypothetical protein
MIGNAYADLQNRLFTIFQFVFVARMSPPGRTFPPHIECPRTQALANLAAGVIAQTQPKFIANRDIFEGKSEKKKTHFRGIF